MVYKVLFKNGSTIFRSEGGSEIKSDDIDRYAGDFDDTIKNLATGFDKGYGFTVFKNKENATSYVKKIKEASVFYSFIIRTYKIPRGSKYECGQIECSCIGGNLNATRCESLIK